jgi:hypothetical protein
MIINNNNHHNHHHHRRQQKTQKHSSTAICRHYHRHGNCGGWHIHHGRGSRCGNGVHVSDGDCSNGVGVVSALPPPHGGDEYASPDVEQG